jgi:hypothetical protein
MDEKDAPKGKTERNNANENKEENNRTMPATHLASRSTPPNCGVFKIVIIAIYRSLRIVLAVCEDGLESAGWCRIVLTVDFSTFITRSVQREMLASCALVIYKNTPFDEVIT